MILRTFKCHIFSTENYFMSHIWNYRRMSRERRRGRHSWMACRLLAGVNPVPAPQEKPTMSSKIAHKCLGIRSTTNSAEEPYSGPDRPLLLSLIVLALRV